jgi:Tol biopolymer transport system component
LRLSGVRTKDAAFGAVGVVLAIIWLVAAIRVWPAIAPSARATPTPRPSSPIEVVRLNGSVAISAGGDIYVIRDAQMTRIASGGGRHDPALSADGTKLAFTLDQTIDGNRNFDGQTVPAHLAYSNVMARATSGGADEMLVNGLQKREANGFHVVEFESQPAWSADGSAIAFISDGGAGADLQVLTTATKRIATLSQGSVLADPAWAPDGKTIAVTTYTQGSPAILLVSADGRSEGERLKIARDGDVYRPSYSPDGKWLIATLRSSRGNDLIAVDLSTTRVVDLTSDGKSWGGVFSPDGTQVAFLRETDGAIDLYAMDVKDALAGGAPKPSQQVTHDGRIDGTSRPSWSR